jgi:hypothetical protein
MSGADAGRMDLSRLACIAVFAAAGCGTSISTTAINAPPRPMAPRPPETVEVFTSGAPPRPHVDVAILEAEESSGLSVADTGDMIRSLREHAAAMGCDAVVVGGSSSRDPGVTDVESWLVENPKGRKGFFGTCIAYTAAPGAAAAAPAPAAAAPAPAPAAAAQPATAPPIGAQPAAPPAAAPAQPATAPPIGAQPASAPSAPAPAKP